MHAELYSCVSSGLCGLWTVQRQVMKILPILVLAFASSALCAPHPRGKAAQQVKYSSSGQELYFEQPLDHFNYIIDHTWRQRYFLTDTNFKNGPLFFYTGNEGPIESFMDNSGFIFKLGQDFNALVVFAEHRYYGKSLPFGEYSFEKANIGYLSAEQALADFALLVRMLKEKYSIDKVISFGGSYGGMLSAWFRFKYPNVVDGALAASAPIYDVADDITPRTAFFEKVTEDFAKANSMCPPLVREAYTMAINLAKQGEDGLKKLTESFSLCHPLTSDKVKHLLDWVRNSFTQIAMVDYPYPANFLAPLPAYPVTYSCQLLLNETDRLRGLAQAAGLFYNGTTGSLECFDIMKEYIECADVTGCGTGPASTSWDFQSCTEMTLACDTNNVTDMFPPSTYDSSGYCESKWGVEHRKGWMDTQFWGNHITTASNIIFSNGDLDPWSVGGVKKDLSDSLIAIIIEGGAHHLDLRSANPADPPSVVKARQQEKDTIAKWIQ